MFKGLLFLALMGFPATDFQQDDRVVLEIAGLRNARGQVLVSVFRSADGFPSRASKAHLTYRKKITGEKIQLELSGLKQGNFAVAVLHDENGDGRMNTNWAGLPKEGFGFSNDAMGVMGPPSFNKAMISYPGGSKSIVIRARYY